MTMTNKLEDWRNKVLEEWRKACETLTLNDASEALNHVTTFDKVLNRAAWRNTSTLTEAQGERLDEALHRMREAVSSLEETLQELIGEGFCGEEYEATVMAAVEACLSDLETAGAEFSKAW